MGCRWFLGTAAAVSTLVIGAGRAPVWSLDVPSASMTVDSTRARLGDPLQLRLSLSFATGGEPRFPDLADLPGGCVARSLPETAVRRRENGIDHAEMRYELRCYELGNHEIPPPEVAIFGPGADTLIRPPQAIEIAIVGTREDGDGELRDIRPPVHIPGGIPLWLLAVALVKRFPLSEFIHFH